MFSGMDLAQIRSMAAGRLRAATDLRGLVADLTNAVEAAPWRGPDRDRFVDKWHSHHAVRINQIAGDLEDASDDAHAQVRRQEAASS